MLDDQIVGNQFGNCSGDDSRFELYSLAQQPPFHNSIEGVAGIGPVEKGRENIVTSLSLFFD